MIHPKLPGLVLVCLSLGLAGCLSTAEAPAPLPEASVTAPPTREIGMNLESHVAAARADLAERLGVAAGEVELVEARHVTWADSSLGCPQPGMSYMQALVPGVLVRLSVAGREYRYHGGSRGRPSLCTNPSGDPLPGVEER